MSDSKPRKYTAPFEVDDDAEQEEPDPAHTHPGKQIAWQDKMGDVGILPKFQDAHLSSNCAWMQEHETKRLALNVALRFSSRSNGEYFIERDGVRYHSLLFTGGFGTGKTWLATATFKRILYSLLQQEARRATGLWRRFYTFIGECQSTYSPSADSTLIEVLSSYQNADILLLDDLGDLKKDVETNDRRELLGRVIDHRNDSFLPTIMNTNLSVPQLKEQFGERTFERVKEMAVFVKLEGANLRDNAIYRDS